jgi:hypothetical protein
VPDVEAHEMFLLVCVPDIEGCGVRLGHFTYVDGVGDKWGELNEDDDDDGGN